MFKRNHLDGTPLNSSEISSVESYNDETMSQIKSAMSSASSAYSFGGSLLSSLSFESSLLSSNPFTLDDSQKSNFYKQSYSGIVGMRKDLLSSATSLSATYSRVKDDQATMKNGTTGQQLAESMIDSKANVDSSFDSMRARNDPTYSLSASASQSISASIASLSPSERVNKLNSIVNNRNTINPKKSHDNNGFVTRDNWQTPRN